MTEHEQKMEERFSRIEREARRHDRIIEILLVAFLAIGGWTAVKVVDNSQQIAVIKARLDHIETRLDRIEAYLNILVARKNGEDADAGAPKQSKLGTEQGQLATR